MRYSKAKLQFMANNKARFQVLSTLETGKGKVPEADNKRDMEWVICMLDSAPYFRNMGGTERITISAEINGDGSLVTINCFSRSPNGSDWANRHITLVCNADTIYILANV